MTTKTKKVGLRVVRPGDTLGSFRPDVILRLRDLTSKRSVRVLSGEISYFCKHTATTKRPLAELAAKANLGVKTVSRIWSRETVEPRWSTIVALYDALDFNAVRFERVPREDE